MSNANRNTPGFNKPGMKRPRKRMPPKNSPQQPNNNWLFWLVLGFIFLILMSQSNSMTTMGKYEELSYNVFYKILEGEDTALRIQKIRLIESTENVLEGNFDNGTQFKVIIPQHYDESLIDLIRKNVDDFTIKPPALMWYQIFLSFGPIIFIILIIWYFSHRGSQMGNKIWSFGKSRAKMNDKIDNQMTFNDVAGVDEAKEELQEVIEFLKEPKKFERLGGKIPKGVLLVGPPGTGKTLLAKAVAGEAEVPFFSLSGSDFVEMFVGVGASRVRDLFEQGRKAAKGSGKGAIIFIDEIDAVGRLRFAGIGGGNDEREQTLNALLVEMDGFVNQGGLILIAATNRPDTLDPALLRPGRFDRQVVVGLPDINGREGILKVHSKSIKLDPAIDLRKIAQQTVYFSGADLANVCNEAALLASRRDKNAVGMDEFYAAVERVTMGPEKKSRTTSKAEKEMTAYHEAGHALLSLFIDEVNTFTKVSIIPRGMTGGYTLTPPTEDKHFLNKKELTGQMTVLLGGLVSEEIYIGDTSTGVSNDLERVTQLAHNMVCVYGMSEKMGTLAYGKNEQAGFLGRDLMQQKDYSDETAKKIDDEIRNFVNQAYNRAKDLLTKNRDKLDKLALALVEKEVMTIDESLVLLGMADEQKSQKQESSSSAKMESNEDLSESSNSKPSNTQTKDRSDIQKT